jgi:hypothetical protein
MPGPSLSRPPDVEIAEQQAAAAADTRAPAHHDAAPSAARDTFGPIRAAFGLTRGHHTEATSGGAAANTADKTKPWGSSGRQVAQVEVFPHDTWEELDLAEGGRRTQTLPTSSAAGAAAGAAGGAAGAAAGSPAKPSRWANNKRRVALVPGVAGVLLLALALGLGLGLGLQNAHSTRPRVHRTVSGGPIAPKAPAAGTTASRLAVSDEGQLRALLGVKAAVDTGGVLAPTWTQASGRNHGYCKWRFVVCDASKRVVEGLNMTTDAYEAVLSGVLPSGAVLKGPLPASWAALPSLRRLTLWDNRLDGGIPASWSDMQALEVLDLSYNKLSGPLPPTFINLVSLQQLMLDVNRFTGTLPEEWGELDGLAKLFLSENQLSGSIPASWGGMRALTDLWMDYNKLSGALPASLGNLSQLASLALNDNDLSGPIPRSWSGLKSLVKLWAYNNPRLSGCVPLPQAQLDIVSGFRLHDYVLMGTKVTGFC